MNLPTEKHIEKYVLSRTELSIEEQRWIQECIEKNEGVRLLADWFKTFYGDAGNIESIEERPEYFSPVIELEPVKRNSLYSSGVFVLAAQTSVKNRTKKNLNTIRTFISEEHKTLIRILYNSLKNQSKLHVISEFVREDDIVLVELRDSENTVLVSDPGGTFVISNESFSQEAIKSWKICELHLPISKIKVFKNSDNTSLNFDTKEAYFERDELVLESDGKQLDITFSSSDCDIPKKMVIYTGDSSSIWPLEGNKCSISIDDLSGSVTTLYFYK